MQQKKKIIACREEVELEGPLGDCTYVDDQKELSGKELTLKEDGKELKKEVSTVVSAVECNRNKQK